jgi:hypothetical protein
MAPVRLQQDMQMENQPEPQRQPDVVRARTIGECWIGCIRTVLAQGRSHRDEDAGLLEVLGLTIEVLMPKEFDPFIDAHGDNAVTARTLTKFTKDALLPDRPFTYGQRIHDFEGIDQFEWMVRRLNAKPETKSATICLLEPGSESPTLPCLTTVDAKIRHGLLDLQFFFRSQNIVGRQYANLAALARLQHDLARRCGVGPGALRGYIASAHIYDYDIDEARRLCAGEVVKIFDRYYSSGPASIRRPSV